MGSGGSKINLIPDVVVDDDNAQGGSPISRRFTKSAWVLQLEFDYLRSSKTSSKSTDDDDVVELEDVDTEASVTDDGSLYLFLLDSI